MSEPSQNKAPDLAAGVSISQIPDGGILGGTVDGQPVILTRSGGEIRALSGKCTHLGAPLAKGLVVDGAVRCPWHHACFDLKSGEALAAPAFDPLQAWIVVQEGDSVRVTGRREPLAATPGLAEPGPGMVIVGGGAAAYAAAVALREASYGGAITMISDDAREPYDRTKLTKDYLEGKSGDDKLAIAMRSLADLGVTFRGGVEVTRIDRAGKRVELGGGETLAYDKLLLATGAEPSRLDVPGADMPHVQVLRSVADAKAILDRAAAGTQVVVVGSSFIGLEAAASLKTRGFDVTVVTPEQAPMAKKMGEPLSQAIMAVHRAKGVAFRLGAEVANIDSEAVMLKDGTRLPAGLVVVGIGVKPRTALAESAGLTVDNGVVVDARLRTSDPAIFAAGDIARWPDPHSGQEIRVEHWVVAERQGETAAANMMGGDMPFVDVPFFWSKHFDFSFRYVGHAEGWDEIKVEGDLGAKKAVVHFVRSGRDLAVATVGQDLRALEIECDMEAELD